MLPDAEVQHEVRGSEPGLGLPAGSRSPLGGGAVFVQKNTLTCRRGEARTWTGTNIESSGLAVLVGQRQGRQRGRGGRERAREAGGGGDWPRARGPAKPAEEEEGPLHHLHQRVRLKLFSLRCKSSSLWMGVGGMEAKGLSCTL